MSKRQNLISIIMAAYNAETTIETAIRSVVAQAYDNWELYVIDDCSQDNTVPIVLSFDDSRIHLIRNKKNCGVSVSRKKGMDAAGGEWIAVLDSDDAWMPHKLEKQVQLAESTNAELVFTGSAFIDHDGNPIAWELHVPETITYKKLLKQNLISNSSVLVKTGLYRKYYVIEDGMHEDFAIWLRILKDGRTAFGIDEPLLIYRVSKSSKSGNKLRAAKMNWRTYRYIGLNPALASYYMCWYFVKGVFKYKNLKAGS